MRKRTGKKYVPITISLENQMINELEMELKPKESRSAWIADAIKAKLSSDEALETASVPQLLSWLSWHRVIDHKMRWALQEQYELKASIDEHSDQ